MNRFLPNTLTFILLFVTMGNYAQDINTFDLNGAWQFRKAGTKEWLPAQVPGVVHLDLLRNNKIPDPYLHDNESKVQWVGEIGWEYQKSFFYDRDSYNWRHIELVCKGLDTYANVFINDSLVVVADNMFKEWVTDIKRFLRIGTNTIRIQFPSIVTGNAARYKQLKYKLPGDEKVVSRKAAYQFGWDWGPTLITSGIWRPLHIRQWNYTNLLGVQFIQKKLDESVANMSAVFTFVSDVKDTAIITLFVDSVMVFNQPIDLKAGPNVIRGDFNITNPQRWWPNGMGRSFLYNCSYQVDVRGKTIAKGNQRVGLRTIELVQQTDSIGRSFLFRVNGKPVFVKGANYIPQDNFLPRVTDSSYRSIISDVRDAGMNMLRVWGGGVYEKDIFYDLCDENGIMVWQDFMFASTGYPADTLRDEIIKEADYQIKRLRNHPSIAIWCGMNEDVYSWSYRGNYDINAQADNETQKLNKDRWYVNRLKDDPIILTMILRGMVSKYGLGLPYVESSPHSTFDDVGNWPYSGNSHISSWKTALFDPEKHPENWRKHFEQVCSFNSEFCIQGPANVKTIKHFMAPENHWPPNEAWIYHVQRGHQNIPHYEQTMYIAGATIGKINSLQEYVKYAQATHVEQTRAEYESSRRDRPNNGGTMSWMFNDCWPTSNWSVIDYYRQEKPSYYAAKRACAPVLPIVFERKGQIEFLIGNDTLATQEVKVVYGQEKLNGEKVWSGSKSFTVARNSTLKFDSMLKDSLNIPYGDFIFIDAEINNRKLSRVIYFPDGWKDIPWPSKPKIELLITKQLKQEDGWITEVRLRSDKFVRLCHVLLKAKYECSILPVKEELRCDYSDNYFDLSAGDEHTIIISSHGKILPKDLFTGHWLTEWE